jgi:hypothetical protein
VRWLLVVVLLTACGEAAVSGATIDVPVVETVVETVAPTSTAWQTTNLPPPLSTDPPQVDALARRGPAIQVHEPPPRPFDPIGYVNSLAYCWQCPEPAMEAYRVVAAWWGWDAWTIEARATFVQRIMATESAFCWNARAWSYGTALLMPCEQIGQGTRDDVGFGQITNVLRPLTCEKAGICSIADTIASPWNSMVAYVVVLDELGKRPWCYERNHHVRNGDCATWPG